ncbi:MAG: hypothetical protein H0X24_00225 [Ktedonobacterales bacterium]|nr:hypothetical protein [Ktedonobacterales bacterium]
MTWSQPIIIAPPSPQHSPPITHFAPHPRLAQLSDPQVLQKIFHSMASRQLTTQVAKGYWEAETADWLGDVAYALHHPEEACQAWHAALTL